MGKNTILQRLERLRRWMGERGVSACVVPQADPHLGEYVDAHWQIRAWFSGFTGSAGTLVVTRSRAALWTDSRYFLQAEKQLQGSSIVLMREGIDTSWQDWLAGHGKVAADARLFSCARWRELKRKLPLYDEASFEELWEDRPAQTCAPAFVLAPALCGEEASAKLQRLRDAVNLKAEKYLLLSSLDAIGWLLNIRGNDLKYSPLLRCYLLVGASDGVLFAGKGALDERVSDYLASLGLDVCDYERLRERLQSLLPDSLSADFAETPAAVAEWTVVTQVTDPVPQWKARKNPAEQAALREAMLQDGVMWVRFLRRFSERNRGERPMRESDVSALLTRLKSERPGYRGESFETIAAAGDHGAVVHYAVTPETDRVIGDSGLLLIDTGTQYDGATTDMTRTLACGALTDTERRDCTLVMKAHIALATAVFPQGMTGAALDGIARRPLWDAGLDYGHGTGHGVGAMLHVHEDPVRVSWRSQCRFMPGMVTSDEPGLYREGRHGVRLENMLVADVDRETEFGCFLQFNVLTLCPFDLSILIPELLTPEERGWLNGYHRRIKAALKPLLTPDEYDWLNKYAYEI